jgi:hypothetical protein
MEQTVSDQTMRDLSRAFGTADREQWTESQRRVVMRLEWLERTMQEQAIRLARFERAAANAWLHKQEAR